jgi:hypothetical protein
VALFCGPTVAEAPAAALEVLPAVAPAPAPPEPVALPEHAATAAAESRTAAMAKPARPAER